MEKGRGGGERRQGLGEKGTRRGAASRQGRGEAEQSWGCEGDGAGLGGTTGSRRSGMGRRAGPRGARAAQDAHGGVWGTGGARERGEWVRWVEGYRAAEEGERAAKGGGCRGEGCGGRAVGDGQDWG